MKNEMAIQEKAYAKTTLNLSNGVFVAPKPTSFENVIGQTDVKKKLSFFVNSHSENTPVPTMLFTGSQGLGKSYMAQKIADSLDRELIEVNCGSLQTSEDFIEGVLMNKVSGVRPKTILLDEAHQLSPDIITNLLTLLNPNSSNANSLMYKGWNIRYDFVNINTILATTDAHKIFRPLLNRCVEIYFKLYSNKDLYGILSHYLKGISITCNIDDISYACRGRARDAFLLSQNIKRYCNMNNTMTFDNEAWDNIKDIFGIHANGLNSQEIELLHILHDNSPISANSLAVKMGVNVANIESEIEVRPRELGFIENTTKGRLLTSAGEDYINVL